MNESARKKWRPNCLGNVLPQGFLSGAKSKAYRTDIWSNAKTLEAEMLQIKEAENSNGISFQSSF